MQEINGWLYPDDVDVPTQSFYRMEFGGRTVWDLDKYGHIYLARQVGLEAVETELVDSGLDSDGIRYAAAKTAVTVNGGLYSAIGGADETSQQVRDPEHTHSVAATRSLKNAIKLALGIRPADKSSSDEVAETGAEMGTETAKAEQDEPLAVSDPEPTPRADDELEW